MALAVLSLRMVRLVVTNREFREVVIMKVYLICTLKLIRLQEKSQINMFCRKRIICSQLDWRG
jgi:hypothetical protein